VTVSLNTLRLCRQLLGNQSLSVNASREEINAVLDARDEIDRAIEGAERADATPVHNGRVTKSPAKTATESL